MIKTVGAYTLLAVLGTVVAIVGAASHRAIPFSGVILSVSLVFAAAIFARSWKLWSGVGVFATTWFALTFVFAMEGPGGSVLIADDLPGRIWVIAGAAAITVVCLIPRSLLMGPDHVAQ
jgi:hypothetical protein